jgi:hypothetical protein
MVGRRESPREPADRLLGELVHGCEVRSRRRRATVETGERALEARLRSGMESRGSLARTLEQAPALGPRGFNQRLGLALGSLDRAGGLPLSREYPVDRLCDLRIG